MTGRCIPTCVGQTLNSLLDLYHLSVYPHLRGADNAPPDRISVVMGVSPPAWGRLTLIGITNRILRCIPTCVGQTKRLIPESIYSWVYPHLRGADFMTCSIVSCISGVSPPAWGRQSTKRSSWSLRGCIPTCVGQTQSGWFARLYAWVYPHLRGADAMARAMARALWGVSPPAWGRLLMPVLTCDL